MKEVCKKLSNALKIIFGYGIMLTLLAGGMTFFGYVAALIIGGDVAAAICTFIYKSIIPVIIYVAVIMVLLGLLAMYLNGEVALTTGNKKASKNQGET
jgi:hypothetical protein